MASTVAPTSVATGQHQEKMDDKPEKRKTKKKNGNEEELKEDSSYTDRVIKCIERKAKEQGLKKTKNNLWVNAKGECYRFSYIKNDFVKCK